MQVKAKTRSSIIWLGGIVLTIHIFGFILYGVGWSNALAFRYGVLSNTEFHLWLATISFPTAFIVAFLERHFKRRLSYLVIMVLFWIWFLAMLYVFYLMPPDRKVMIDPSKNQRINGEPITRKTDSP